MRLPSLRQIQLAAMRMRLKAIMSVLILIGAGSLRLTLPLALGVMGLVLLVVFSYIQTILHYPDGGGAYTVTKDNLGETPSLFAASALLIDYILTVSVSVSAGVRALTSAMPELIPYSIPLALVAILLLTWVNLRGVRESGTIFAVPTYLFVLGVLLTIVVGLVRMMGLFGLSAPVSPVHEVAETVSEVGGFLYIWLLLRAFAAGCTALTGIEAISNGVQAFKPPESKNAAKTMVVMGVVAMTLFVGITFVSTNLHLIPYEEESILSQMTRSVTAGLPGGRFLYYWVQLFYDADFIFGCKYWVSRFSSVELFFGEGWVYAAMDAKSWRSPGLQRRHLDVGSYCVICCDCFSRR